MHNIIKPFRFQIKKNQFYLFNLLNNYSERRIVNAKFRHKNFIRKSNPIPSNIKLHVLGNGSKGCARCLYMTTSYGSYIFNCGEGMQRLAFEHKFRISELNHVFITHKSWKNIGGLPGLSLSLQDTRINTLILHGPTEIIELYDIIKNVIDLEHLKIVQRNYIENSFIDNCMEVIYVPLYSNATKNISDTDCKNSEVRNMNERSQLEVPVAYICKCHTKPPEFLLEKCIQKGVEIGPLLKELRMGNDITLDNDHIVQYQDVISPEESSFVFIVIECPSIDYIDGLLENKSFEPYQASGLLEKDQATVVIHFTELDVLSDPRYQQWMNRFSDSTSHLLLNSSNSSLSSKIVHKIQNKLNLIHPQIFPLLQESDKLEYNIENKLVFQAENMMSYYFRPKYGLKWDTSVKLDENISKQRALDDPIVISNLQELQRKLIKHNELLNNKPMIKEYPEVAFLGTGSCAPTVVRNAPAYLVNISPETCMLLDCGEGTCIQLYRLFGAEQVKNIFRKLSCIFISHLHADHHLGLIELLRERREILIKDHIPTLYIVAPNHIITWLNNCHEKFEYILNCVRTIPNIELNYQNCILKAEEYENLLKTVGLQNISTVIVDHNCEDSHGITLTTNQGYKIVYSGDTMPCDQLIEAGQNCNLLIHEASVGDGLEEVAYNKTHSTTSQAIEVGRQMCAQFIILTHFSHRYHEIPPFPNYEYDNVGYAYDNMIICPYNLHLLPHFLPSLKSLFSKQYEKFQKRTFIC